MIYIDVDDEILRNKNNIIIGEDDILSFLNEKVKIINGDFSLKVLHSILGKYEILLKVNPNLENLKDKIDHVIVNNSSEKIKGRINIFETYRIKPIIYNKDYLNNITPYSDIEKSHKLFYINDYGEKQEILTVNVNYFLYSPIKIKNKILFYENMFNDSSLFINIDIDITFNTLLFLLSRVNYEI